MAIDQYSGLIDDAANRYGIPTNIFRSLVQTESSGNAYAVSSAGAKGLAQLMPIIYRDNEYGAAIDPFNPAANLDRGAAFLSDMYKKYGNWDDALSHYNAGFNLEAGRGYAQKVLTGAGVTEDDNSPGFLQRMKDFIKKFGLQPIPGIGIPTTPITKDKGIVGGLFESLASEKVKAAVDKIPGGIATVIAWFIAVFLAYLSIKKLIER